jgi:hypothetical protein
MMLLGGCQTPSAEPTSTQAPTATAEPTDTPVPTAEPTSTEAAEAEPTPTVEAESEASPTPAPTATSEPEPLSTWAADGVISPDEYDQQADLDGIRLWWSTDGESLYLAIEGDTTGWVAVGINPSSGMQDADYVFGYVADGEASIWDAWGTARTGANHPPDEDLGGTYDITAFAGVEENGVTRFEVQMPLDSGDQYDHVLIPGETYPLIAAIGPEDAFNAYHIKYARADLTIMP